MQAKQVEEWPFFIGQQKSGTPCMPWTNFINRKLIFPDQSSIAKWLIKEKKDIFETLFVPLLDDIKLKSQIINL
jgi:hypothetical protein